MENLQIISTDGAPKAVGPYSQGVRVGNLLYTCGQVALDPGTMKLVEGDIQLQTVRVMKNLEAILKAAGLDFSRVVKTTCFVTDMSQFATFNEVYGQFFSQHKPARTTVEVSKLPLGASVEVELVAAF